MIPASGRVDPEVPLPGGGDICVAVWQTGSVGWIQDLVDEGKAAATSRGGYPDSYLVRAEDFRRQLREGLPHENDPWIFGADDVITSDWLGKTTIAEDVLAACDPGECLLFEVWDES